MKTPATILKLLAVAAISTAVFAGCESTGGGVSGSVYYGTGFYDPWYYGGYHDDIDIIVTPPPRPGPPGRPTHPIAPPGGGMRPMPMPTIPMSPRVGGRR